MSWKDGLRVGLTLTVPVILTGGLTVALLTTAGRGQLPSVTQFAGFVGVMVAALIAAGTLIPRIGGESA